MSLSQRARIQLARFLCLDDPLRRPVGEELQESVSSLLALPRDRITPISLLALISEAVSEPPLGTDESGRRPLLAVRHLLNLVAYPGEMHGDVLIPDSDVTVDEMRIWFENSKIRSNKFEPNQIFSQRRAIAIFVGKYPRSRYSLTPRTSEPKEPTDHLANAVWMALSGLQSQPLVVTKVLKEIEASAREPMMGGSELAVKIGERKKGGMIAYQNMYSTPGTVDFWNNLLLNARNRFIRVGRSNKSWIGRSSSQSELLGGAIRRLVSTGGTFTLVSSGSALDIESNRQFLLEYVGRDVISEFSRPMEGEVHPKLRYLATDRSNYNAVVSDERLVLLPAPNSSEFAADALVIDIHRDSSQIVFANYFDDILRLIDTAMPIGIL